MSKRERRQALADKRRTKEAKEAERELHAHFAGRRDARRFDTFLPCRVAGKTGVYLAQVLDISRSGALIRILDARFPEPGAGEELMRFAERVTEQFGSGIEITVRGSINPIRADLVRVTTRQQDADDPTCHLVGVNFEESLGEAQCHELGFTPIRERCERSGVVG